MKIKNRIQKPYSTHLFNELYIFYYIAVNNKICQGDILFNLDISKRSLQRYIKELNKTRSYFVGKHKETFDKGTEDEFKELVYGYNFNYHEKINYYYTYRSKLDISHYKDMPRKSHIKLDDHLRRLNRLTLFLYIVSSNQRRWLSNVPRNLESCPQLYYKYINAQFNNELYYVFKDYKHYNLDPITLKRDFNLVLDVFNAVNQDEKLLFNSLGLIDRESIFSKNTFKILKEYYDNDPIEIRKKYLNEMNLVNPSIY